jgi:CheY-like chemotaxis protein
VARIVVIENDKLMQRVFAMSLSSRGWDIYTCAYTDIDLPTLSKIHPDLIILDFKEPLSKSAWSFLQMLKMDDATAKIPILITATLNLMTVDIRAYLALQYIQIVYMPFDLGNFTEIIQHLLSLATEPEQRFSTNRNLPILVVEDNEDLRENLTTILNLEGYQVVTADNGLLALEAVYKSDHSLIFLDIQMPIMDGYEFLKIYARQLRRHNPIILLSADPTVYARSFPTFVVEIVSKPYEIDALLKLAEKYAQAT